MDKTTIIILIEKKQAKQRNQTNTFALLINRAFKGVVTELELLNRIKENPDYFSEIFGLYYKSIFGYIFRRTSNFDDTADITAETFFKVFTHIKNFSYKGISIKI